MHATETQTELLAKVAAGLAGGRHAWRVTDDSVKESARQLVAENRRQGKNMRQNAARRARRALMQDAYFSDYEPGAVEAIRAIWQNMPKRSLMRDIARALFRPDIETEFVLPDDWRDIVRAHARGRAALKSADIPIRLADFRPDGMVANYARKHWHQHTHGTLAIHGVDVLDLVQDAYVSAIESGDTIRVSGRNVPSYAQIFRHVRRALTTGVHRYAMATYAPDTSESFDWSEVEPKTVEEWIAYESWRDMTDAIERASRRAREERESRLSILDSTRRAMAELVMSGMTVRQIANTLGRTVESMLSELDETIAPAMVWHSPVVTEADRQDAIERANAERAHAERLRAIQAIKYREYAANVA